MTGGDFHCVFVDCHVKGCASYDNHRTRGTIEVFHGNKRYEYRVTGSSVSFKRWLVKVFSSGTPLKISGRGFRYKIE